MTRSLKYLLIKQEYKCTYKIKTFNLKFAKIDPVFKSILDGALEHSKIEFESVCDQALLIYRINIESVQLLISEEVQQQFLQYFISSNKNEQSSQVVIVENVSNSPIQEKSKQLALSKDDLEKEQKKKKEESGVDQVVYTEKPTKGKPKLQKIPKSNSKTKSLTANKNVIPSRKMKKPVSTKDKPKEQRHDKAKHNIAAELKPIPQAKLTPEEIAASQKVSNTIMIGLFLIKKNLFPRTIRLKMINLIKSLLYFIRSKVQSNPMMYY